MHLANAERHPGHPTPVAGSFAFKEIGVRVENSMIGPRSRDRAVGIPGKTPVCVVGAVLALATPMREPVLTVSDVRSRRPMHNGLAPVVGQERCGRGTAGTFGLTTGDQN
jgi:hypothetical protein